jgi:hypothetical protein
MTVERSNVRDERLDRAAAATGIGFVVLALVAFLIALGPGDDEDIREYFADNAGAIKWQAFLFGLSGFLYLWFFGTLAAATRAARAAESRLPAITVAAAGATAGLYVVGIAVHLRWRSSAARSRCSGTSAAPRSRCRTSRRRP